MSSLSFNQTLALPLDTAIERVTESLKTRGFGILTRIDFDQKIKEKLGHAIPRTVILGACNPGFAYEAYRKNPDLLLLVPCNVVLEEKGPEKIEVRIVKPSSMVDFLDHPGMGAMAKEVDQALESALRELA
jgi:uncharacterized protein (DUF302 family)